MAKTYRMNVKRRWWGKPYMFSLQEFIRCFGFAILDDVWLEWFERATEWIVRCGLRCDLVEV